MEQNICYKCKEVDFHGVRRTILYRNRGHPRTALLAFMNCLLLNGTFPISPDASNDYPLQSVIARLTRMYNMRNRTVLEKAGVVLSRDTIKESVKFLSSLFDVEVGFTSNDHIRSSTGRLHIFEHYQVPLLHAWVVHPDDNVIFDAVGTGYHTVFRVEHAVQLPQNADPLVNDFLNAGVSAFGINELLNKTEEGKVYTLFKNGSFHTLTKHIGTLYLLNNDVNASDQDMWKVFNEQDDGQFCNSNFVVEITGEQPQAEVLSQTSSSSVSERMHKCLRAKCQADFCSVVNLNRHKQVHSTKQELKMASFTKSELGEHWNTLNLEEAGKVLSIKDMNIEGVSGDLLYKVIENVDNGDELYNRANRMKVVLDGTKPISSDELFTMLDEGSENNAFSTDIRFCPEKTIFSEQKLLLRDLNNVFACCCYFMEKNMVLSWFVHKTAEATRHAGAFLPVGNDSFLCGFSRCTRKFTSKVNFNRHKLSHAQNGDFKENIDAISKYWDDLTCDQIREIVSLKNTKITGLNLKNLQRRLKDLNQNDPLATTGQQLIDILMSSEKMTLEEMLAVLEKASENTHFSNDIRSCDDKEIFEIGDKDYTPTKDVAIMSYMIEKKLVEHWFNYKESVIIDTQQQHGQDADSERSDHVEPIQHQESFRPNESVTSDTQGKSVHYQKEKRKSTELEAGESDVPTIQDTLNPTSGILLEEFIGSNKLTKVYKIRPKHLFKALKRSLKKLKKDFESKKHKKKVKAVFKLSCAILTRWGRKCARGFVLWIVRNHREGKSWNGSFQLSDMHVVNGQFIISKEADMKLTLESATADFESLWELLLVPFYKNSELGSHPLYFDQFGHDIFDLPDPVTDPDGFMKHEKYLALHFAFMPPLSRVTLLISLYKAFESNRLVPDHACQPLNTTMGYDWRDIAKTLPILRDVYYFNFNGEISPYTCTYFHLLKFTRHYGSHDLDHTKIEGVEQMVPDMIVTDLVIGQLLASSLCDLVLFIVNHTNMDGRFFRPFQQFESSDGDAFFCFEVDSDDDSPESATSSDSDASA